jgi:hypothetical protein
MCNEQLFELIAYLPLIMIVFIQNGCDTTKISTICTNLYITVQRELTRYPISVANINKRYMSK